MIMALSSPCFRKASFNISLRLSNFRFFNWVIRKRFELQNSMARWGIEHIRSPKALNRLMRAEDFRTIMI